MYLKWMDGRQGKIFFDRYGLRSFIERNLCEGVFCHDVELLGEKNQIFITLIKDNHEVIYVDRVSLSEDLTDSLACLGIDAVVSWKNVADEEQSESTALTEKPYFWASLVTIVAALLKLGVGGSLLCLLSGSLAYCVVSFFQSDYGKRLRETIIEIIREALD